MQRATFAHHDRGARESWEAPSLRLQRKCACGQHTIAGGSCVACRNRSGASTELGCVRESNSTPTDSFVPEALIRQRRQPEFERFAWRNPQLLSLSAQ